MGNERLRKLSIYGGLVIAVLIAGILGVLFRTTAQSEAGAEEAVARAIRAEMQTHLAKMDAAMEETVGLTDGIAQTLRPGAMDRGEISRVLYNLRDAGRAYMAIYCTTDGTGCAIGEVDYDLTGTDYFERIPDAAYRFLFTENDGVSGTPAVLYVSPVFENERISGWLLSFLDPDELMKSLLESSAKRYAFYALLGEDRELLCAGGSTAGSVFFRGDFFDNIRVGARRSSEWSAFRQKVQYGKPAEVSASMDGESMWFFAETVAESGWLLIVGVNGAYLEAEAEGVNQPLGYLRKAMAALLALIAAAYIVSCVLIHISSLESGRKLEDKAETDLLTGLSNKISTENLIRKYIAENPAGHGVFILVDVDNFKKVNDTMGHAFGDLVLKELGTGLRSLYRVTDIVGRIGGDEFLVFLKDISDTDVIRREANKLVTFFHGFEVGEYVKYSVTASLGAAIYPEEGTSFEELYKNADAAVYAAKRGGKNRLVFYDERETVPQGPLPERH